MHVPRSLVVFVSLLLFAIPARSQAPDQAARVRELYESGTTHYNLREYQDALSDFKSAYRMRPDPVFLFNIAQCYRQLGDPEQAASYYRAFRRELPDAANRADVDRLIAEMDKAIAAHRANIPPSGPAPLTTPAPATQATPATNAAAAPATTPAATTLTATSPTAKKPLAKKAWFWVTLGGAVIVAGGAVALGVTLSQPRAPSPSLGRFEGP